MVVLLEMALLTRVRGIILYLAAKKVKADTALVGLNAPDTEDQITC